ncbi:MAG: DUF3306 domain-containing protein [Betaproteobacteria bacterium]|nr:DUF3306 domain-containing protein [Betaproteobacteria bacterium]
MSGSDEDFLSRWSRRKRAIRSGAPVEEVPPVAKPVPATAAGGTLAEADAPPPEPLPPVESLTPESDFTPFMDSKVDPGVRREALKKLFSDPRFNVMDRLDTYIDDYSLPDPLPPEWLGKIAALSGLGDVPGRQKAEREARESAERQATAGPGSGDSVPEGHEAAPTESPQIAQAGIGQDADEGQVEPFPEPSGCATPAIPARKMGD